MYEHKSQPLAPLQVYRRRLFKNFLIGSGIIIICLCIGIMGYHFLAQIPWLEAIHNASMILSGMGPVAEIKSTAGILFSSFYALFSGVVFITNIGVLIAPAAHRFFHRLHLEQKSH